MRRSKLSLLKHWQYINNLSLFWKTRQTGLLSHWRPWLLRRHNMFKHKFYPLFVVLWFSACFTDVFLLLCFWLPVVFVVRGLLDWHRKFLLIRARQEYLNLGKNVPRTVAYCISGQLMVNSYAVKQFQSIDALLCPDSYFRALTSSQRSQRAETKSKLHFKGHWNIYDIDISFSPSSSAHWQDLFPLFAFLQLQT